MNDNTKTFNLTNFDSRLKDWRHNLVDQIEASATSAINSHAGNLNSNTMSNNQKMETEMDKVMKTALQKVDEMKEHGIDPNRIRETILPAIQNMGSPYAKETELNTKFGQLQEAAFNRVDAQIVGNDQVFRRNMRM